MKETQLYTEPNDSNINDKNSNLIRKQNNYIGSIQKTTKLNSQQNKINQNPVNVKNYRNNKQNQNHNINKFLNNITTHSTTTYYKKRKKSKYPTNQDPTTPNVMKQKKMDADTYKSNIRRDSSNYLKLLRQYQINKNKAAIANPYHPKQNTKTHRQNIHTTKTTIIGTNGYLNNKINKINTTTHSNLELGNKRTKSNAHNLNWAQLFSFLDIPNTKLLRNRIYREKYGQQKEVKAKRAQSGNDKIKEQVKKI